MSLRTRREPVPRPPRGYSRGAARRLVAPRVAVADAAVAMTSALTTALTVIPLAAARSRSSASTDGKTRILIATVER